MGIFCIPAHEVEALFDGARFSVPSRLSRSAAGLPEAANKPPLTIVRRA
jgi:hypothetical protein